MKINNNKIKLIIGLGNPGKEYKNSRHNAGFKFINSFKNFLILKHQLSFVEKNNKEYEIIYFKNIDLKLFKPLMYMNNSGLAIKKYLKNTNIKPSEILLIHDDLDIPLGSYKLQFAISPKNHNGVLSIESHLNTNEFWRIRLGIETRNQVKIKGETFVLQNFTQEQIRILDKTINEVISKLEESLN